MIVPVRLQLSRRAGFRLQTLSRATNGLPALNCARPGRLSNPYRVGREAKTAEDAVYLFRRDLRVIMLARGLANYVDLLRGKNLACWCGADEPCHVDVYLELFR